MLTLERTGEARLGQWHQGSARAWAGRVEAAAYDAVIAHLAAGGFPNYTPGPIAPSAHFTLTVETVAGERFSVTDSIYSKNQGLSNALAWLDAVVRQLSGDVIRAGPVRKQRLVVESRPASIEEVG